MDKLLSEERNKNLDSKFSFFSKKVPKITGNLKVKKLEPTRGSLFGGTLLTIDGKGFGTDKEKLEVTVGGYQCIIKEVTPTRILCQIAKMCDTVTVTNDGTGQCESVFPLRLHYVSNCVHNRVDNSNAIPIM